MHHHLKQQQSSPKFSGKCRPGQMLFSSWPENFSEKYQFQFRKKYKLKAIKILRFTSRAFAGCCCSHAGQPGAVLQHATQQHRQSRNLSPKKSPHFPIETPKTGNHKVRNGFEKSIFQLSYLPIEVGVEIWNFGCVELVGRVSSAGGNCWAAAAATAAKMALSPASASSPARILASAEASL